MSDISFTKEQTDAIELKNRDLLVAAAAGSGKTAVLVERIIRRITDGEAPADIDRLLIMTFTNAAAAQMREKILNGIDERLKEDPFNENLRKQSALVHNAMITTIHGFCLNILKNHFTEASLSPDFRVADEGEAKLLKRDALSEVLEEAYEEGRSGFIDMTEAIASGKNDTALEDVIGRLFFLAMSCPEPEAWLNSCISVYEELERAEEPGEEPIIKQYLETLRSELTEVLEGLRSLLSFVMSREGMQKYENTIRSDISAVETAACAASLSGFMEALKAVEFVRFGTGGRKDSQEAPEDKAFLKDRRDGLKERVTALKKKYRSFDLKEERKRIAECIPLLRELVSITEKYMKRYAEKKREANIIDYNDMEQLAIKVLKENDGAPGKEYRELYEEIYVDEYQDSNLVQEELLKEVGRGGNLFMVGDVKQSIYGFRLARPDIFIEKYERFTAGDSKEQRIDLNRNFRSRREVLDSVNEIFSVVMTRENSGIEYDEAAALKFGAAYYGDRDEKYKSELLIAQRGIAETDAKELEALVIAERIIDLRSQLKIFDPDAGGFRPLRFSDIVILLRTSREWDETFQRVLGEKGIPAHISSEAGYFDAYEVALLLDFLRVIDNPRQEIPLAAVLRGPFGKMDDEEMALIRSADTEGCLYDALVKAAENGNVKAQSFMKLLDYYREKTGYTPVYDILREITDGDYGIYVMALENGKKRIANLNMLLKKADDYGKTSYKGLFQFVRYVDMLKKYEVDYGEANLLDENDDVVRIMTIHKSKGLEFPVCFVAGLSKGFNYSDQRGRVITDAEYGVGIDHVDTVRRTRASTLVKDALIKKSIRELRAEELRILYVAMTRAKEKLILTTAVKDAEKELQGYRGSDFDSFLDIILYARERTGLSSFDITVRETGEVVAEEMRDELLKNEAYLCLKKIESKTDLAPETGSDEQLSFAQRIQDKFDYRYEEKEDAENLEKFSVTELKKKHLEEILASEEEGSEAAEELFPERPRYKSIVPEFVDRNREISANLHGTAVHRIFELWDFREADHESIRGFINLLLEQGRIEERLAGSVGIGEILSFAQSPLAGRMKRAMKSGQLYREQPFVIELDGKIVQGIIDAFFIEDGEIVIIDYKTDRVNESTELKKRYELQLYYYAVALNRLLGLPVRERIIYSTVLGRSITL